MRMFHESSPMECSPSYHVTIIMSEILDYDELYVICGRIMAIYFREIFLGHVVTDANNVGAKQVQQRVQSAFQQLETILHEFHV
jgi:hypothetical protein